MLKTLNLSPSSYLTQTPNFTKLPNHERLVMKDCLSLSLIDESIGDLKNLLHVNLKDFKSLLELPRSIYKLQSLKTLILSGCLLIDHLKDDFEQMEGLANLMADNAAITQVRFLSARLRGLVQHGYVSLCGYEGRAQDVFPSLVSSWMSRSNIPLLKNLCKAYHLYFCQLDRIVAFMEYLHFSLQGQQVPSILFYFNWECATKQTSWKTEFRMFASSFMRFVKQATTLLFDSCVDATMYKGEGCLVNFKVPQVIGCQLKAMLLNVVYCSCMDNTTTHQFLINAVIIDYTNATIIQHGRDWVTFHEDTKWQSIIPSVQPGDLAELVLSIGSQFSVKKIAAYLI